PAIDRRIVGAEETTPGAYRFVHALLRDAVDARLTPERRCDLHARCAEALKSQGCLDDEHTYRVARHYWLASPLSGRDRARQWALAAAECARRAHAHELESEQLGHAVQLGAQGGVDAAVQIDCLIGLGQAQFHAGRHADAIASFDRAAAMCRALGDNARFARAVIGRFEVFGETAPTDPQLAAMLAEALELLPEETPTRAILLSAHAFSRFLVPRDRDRWKEGLRLARKTGSSAALARALGIGARSTVQGAPLLDLADELIPAAEQAKESAAVFEGHLSRWSALLQMGRLAEWQAESRAFELLVSHLRHPVWQYRWSMMAAVQTLLKGDLPTAYEGARRARARGEQLGDPVAPAFFGVVAYSLWRAAEPAPDAEPWLREVEDIAARMVQWLPDYLPWRVLMTLIDLTRGRVDAARREYRQIVASGFDTIPADWNYVANLHTLAQAAPRFGTPDEIERLYELLLPFAGQHVVPTFGYFGPVDRELGGLRRTLGDESAAKTHLERALAEVEAIEARPWIDRLKRELAGRS
ncbi:MAG TPA: hypothetical protein VEK07_14600, partial [Polyangiaceae bacterium]|nr:hypothetical protein [Polyangiaceae bacterium]